MRRWTERSRWVLVGLPSPSEHAAPLACIARGYSSLGEIARLLLIVDCVAALLRRRLLSVSLGFLLLLAT
jgi:hypothetical protein